MKLFDTTKKPKIPYDGWKVESHDISLGKINLNDIELYLDDEQKNGGCIKGTKLQEKLKSKPVLNANVLDYLLEHQKLIPKEWESEYVYFWGTIYRSAHGSLYVRCLYFSGGTWFRYYSWLDDFWDRISPAALLASSTKPSKSLHSFDPLNLKITYDGVEYKIVKQHN